MFRQMAITKYLYSDTSLHTLLLISQPPKLTQKKIFAPTPFAMRPKFSGPPFPMRPKFSPPIS